MKAQECVPRLDAIRAEWREQSTMQPHFAR